MARRTIAKDGPHPVDVHVGSRVRLRRTLLGMNRTKLGETLGLTYHQVRNYELGVNRVSASTLWMLSKILDVPVSFFFDELDDERTWSPVDILPKRETLELVRAYYRIRDPSARKRLYDMTQAMADFARG